MKAFLTRLGGYLCLSLGLALMAPAWFQDDLRPETRTREVVMLTALAADSMALAPACPGPPHEIQPRHVAPYPAISQAAAGLAVGMGQAIGPPEFQALAGLLNIAPDSGFCVCLAERVFSLRPTGASPDKGAVMRLVGMTPQGAARYPLLSKEQLSQSPALAAFLDGLTARAKRAWSRVQRQQQAGAEEDDPSSLTGESSGASRDMAKFDKALREHRRMMGSRADQMEALRDRSLHQPYYLKTRTMVPAEQWRAALKSAGAGQGMLLAGDFLVSGEIAGISETVPTPVQGMLLARVLGGCLLLALGFWLMKGLHGPRPGFKVNPGWAAALGDAIVVVAGGAAAYGLCDLVFSAWLGITPMLEKPVAQVMSVMLVPGLAVFAGYNTSAASQSLEITEKGLTRWGAAGKLHVPWEKITGLALRHSHVLVGRVGTLIPRRLQTKLVIMTESDELTLFEPGLKSTKQNMLEAMNRLAPQRLKEDIAALGEQW